MSIIKRIPETLYEISESDYYTVPEVKEDITEYLPEDKLFSMRRSLEKDMKEDAKNWRQRN